MSRTGDVPGNGHTHRAPYLSLLVVVSSLSCHGSAETASPPTSPTSGQNASLTIGGVQLVPVGSTIQRYCEIGAARNTFSIPCPTVAPAPQEWELCRGTDGLLGGAGCFRRPGWDLEEIFHGPPGYQGVCCGIVGHLDVWASTVASPSAGCEGVAPVGTVSIDGVTGSWFLCPSGQEAEDSGHVLLKWTKDGITYGVGMHGHTSVNRRLVFEIAMHLVYQ